ncbi:UDP-N-acetylglucosamine 4,6-dehydratase (inverting) [Candidatus Nitronereus thalassa]|uniref:UDP-N-acetylglucosamine 4,6-dehydratase (Inverting) n=1 Tax=Candidatus Nitronereus thalassa TaxID=3020898 RepID=A0ABU3K665_9BACT|nr:UDP-N-acetylglucosamine 4,6-dehydratase (inverting) [Candidatus Nitronereus thalassa]MDT7041856.1 UDP-N-acetylglucosamine 4,6-dehydratase (inverting) [Candidatus Nitronereus thalassa]
MAKNLSSLIQRHLQGKTILLTGGTGSFGQRLTKILIEHFSFKTLRIFSRDELKQHDMARKCTDDRIRFFIGDVRDESRVRRAVQGVDIVIHAAAMKQVPTCEYNPFEAVRTNVVGAQHLIDAAIDQDVKQIMALSTDKAVNPINLYGATKLCAERIFIQGNSYAGPKPTRMSCVRYGNVLGSRGSVVPVFQAQRKQGTVTVTDKRMTRFWLTLDQAAWFVLRCLTLTRGGEIFVPKIPSIGILDLVEAMAPECSIQYIGLRPGEKLHEVLLTEDESRHAVEYDDLYTILPEYQSWKGGVREGSAGKRRTLPEGYRYSSENNTHWLSVSELRNLLMQNGFNTGAPVVKKSRGLVVR